MTVVETIKDLCRQNKTSIAALERACGFANGSIRKWDTSPTSYDRLQKVADALGVTVADLTGEQQKKPTAESDGPDNPAMEELLELIKDLTEEETALMLARAKKIKESRI